MNRNRVKGGWKQLRGKTKEQWGKLTDNQLLVVAGRRDQLAGRIQARHGASIEQAERQLREFLERNRHWDICA